MGDNYSFSYSKEGDVIVADYGSCGCSNDTLYRYQDGKVEKIAHIFSDDYESYRKEDLPKGRFKKTDWVYCYIETDEESQYYTEDEFGSMFQEKYGVEWGNLDTKNINITYASRHY